MKKFFIIFPFVSFTFASIITIYSDYGWGYYYWLFGWIGPNQDEGVTAAGYSGSIEYRGYTQFSMPGYPGSGTTINSLVLRLCNNTGGAGLSIDINRVTSETPGANECGVLPPIYLTGQPVNSGVEQYTYFDLSGTPAKTDFLNAWQSGANWFGLGYRGAGPMHFFYACWFDEYLDAALIIDYTIGVEEEIAQEQKVKSPELSVYPNPFKDVLRISYIVGRNAENSELKIYDASGRLVHDFSRFTTPDLRPTNIIWSGDDESRRELPAGIYFVKLKGGDDWIIKKIIKIR
uniref:T9SS type A sorting domain-containing protein n=1 Tax=candidate division WOR-3 bacterium TaxID=2052148 RepID=A0A7C4TIQ7_UNCW3